MSTSVGTSPTRPFRPHFEHGTSVGLNCTLPRFVTTNVAVAGAIVPVFVCVLLFALVTFFVIAFTFLFVYLLD